MLVECLQLESEPQACQSSVGSRTRSVIIIVVPATSASASTSAGLVVVVIIATPAATVCLAGVLWHSWTPVFLQLCLAVLECLLRLAALFWGVGILELLAILTDVGNVLAKLITVRSVAASAASAASTATTSMASTTASVASAASVSVVLMAMSAILPLSHMISAATYVTHDTVEVCSVKFR